MLGLAISVEFPWLPLRTLAKLIPARPLHRLFLNFDFIRDYAQRAVTYARDTTRPSIFSYIISKMEASQGMLIDDCIRDEAIVLIIAGSESSATILTYLIWNAMIHSDVQRRLEAEVRGLKDGYADADLEALTFLNAVIEETLRLYGTTSFLPRAVPKRGASLGGYYLPGGTITTTQSFSVQRDPKYWADPDRYVTLSSPLP